MRESYSKLRRASFNMKLACSYDSYYYSMTYSISGYVRSKTILRCTLKLLSSSLRKVMMWLSRE